MTRNTKTQMQAHTWEEQPSHHKLDRSESQTRTIILNVSQGLFTGKSFAIIGPSKLCGVPAGNAGCRRCPPDSTSTGTGANERTDLLEDGLMLGRLDGLPGADDAVETAVIGAGDPRGLVYIGVIGAGIVASSTESPTSIGLFEGAGAGERLACTAAAMPERVHRVGAGQTPTSVSNVWGSSSVASGSMSRPALPSPEHFTFLKFCEPSVQSRMRLLKHYSPCGCGVQSAP